MTLMRGADAILDTLEAVGTDLLIGYIGHTTQELADATRERPGMRTMYPATELGGAHVINGYNIVKGRAAAAGLWHTCGTLLIPAALYEGMFSRIPSVHLGFNVDGSFQGRESMQEMPNVDVLTPMTRYSTRVERPDKLPETISRAAHRAHGAPAGPTFVDIPFDLTVDTAETTVPTGWSAPVNRSGADPEQIRAAARLLVGARRPVMIVGGGAVWSGADEEVARLAELLGIPVTTTFTSQGILPESHPLALGTSGPIGWRCANDWIADADVVLAVGSRLSEWGYAQSYTADMPGRLIHVDTDPAQLGNFYYPEIGVVADARTVLRQLVEAVGQDPGFVPTPYRDRAHFAAVREAKEKWVAGTRERALVEDSPISPWRVVSAIESALDPTDYIVSDAGNNTGWVFQGAAAERSRRLVTTAGAGVLGAGFPMALGVKLARPQSQVVVGVGDGGFGYAHNEIAFALRENIPVTVVVFNDSALGANKGFMTNLYGQPSWTALNNPDFVALARAYGADGERVEDAGQLDDAVKRGVASGTVYVIDVPIGQDYGYPATTSGGKVKWPARQWPADVIGTRSPGTFTRSTTG
ncbi:thiamine pyrophosphate-binding protein [Pseudonocardia nematodicida]|uniref:Thiamine pyrophosphate-binding protein n=1 Tax=Pseudonocardia nematodicida TaxID=1206997 RepID=A0ABV1K5K9_9PSEU